MKNKILNFLLSFVIVLAFVTPIQHLEVFASNTSPSVPAVDKFGWSQVAEAWSYASASTITIPSGGTSRFQVGDKIRINNTSTKYFYVTAVSSTVLTVYAGTDYTVANSAISAISVSRIANPFGFPYKFSYTPTWTGFSANPTGIYEFTVQGGICTVYWDDSNNGTSNTTGYQFSLPITAATRTNMQWFAVPGFTVNNNAGQSTPAQAAINSAGTAVILAANINGSGAGWTASSGKSSGGTIAYRIAGT